MLVPAGCAGFWKATPPVHLLAVHANDFLQAGQSRLLLALPRLSRFGYLEGSSEPLTGLGACKISGLSERKTSHSGRGMQTQHSSALLCSTEWDFFKRSNITQVSASSAPCRRRCAAGGRGTGGHTGRRPACTQVGSNALDGMQDGPGSGREERSLHMLANLRRWHYRGGLLAGRSN